MGDQPLTSGEVSPTPRFSDLFDSQFPYYLNMGMTYEQYWEQRPELVRLYREADKLAQKRQNENMWLQGVYICHALNATVGNMFSKKAQKFKYPEAPFPVLQEDIREKRERERNGKLERAKARMMAFAQQHNAKLHVAAPPREVSANGDGN